MEISKMNRDKRYRTRSPNRKARLVRHLDFLSSTNGRETTEEDEIRYSEFPPKKSENEAPKYERFESISGHTPVYYRIPRCRNDKELISSNQDFTLASSEQFDKRRWLHFFNENLEGYLQCLSSTSGTLRNSVILHLCEEIIPKYVVSPALESALNYEKSRQILTSLSCYKSCCMVMTRALQSLNVITLCDPLTAESARGLQNCEFRLRETMKSDFLASESLDDQRERIRVYGHVLCFLVLHYSKGTFTTYPSTFDIRSFDSIYKSLQDMIRSKNDPELEAVIGFTSQSLTVVRYPKGKFKRCSDNLGKSLKMLDSIATMTSRKTRNEADRELFNAVDGHTTYGATLFLLYLSLKIKYHHGNAYVQYRILQMLQKLLQHKVDEMMGKRPWKSGSIREKKKDWVFLYSAACLLVRIASDVSLSRELRICSVVQSDEVFSLASFFTNTALKKVNGYIRGLCVISELCHSLVHSDIDAISFHIGQLLLMKEGLFNSDLLRDEINKKHLCNIHRNIGLSLNDVINEGEMSLVYKGTIIGAKHSVTVKVCAVHSIEELNMTDTPSIRKICNEIHILRNLHHCNILPMLAYWNSASPVHYITTFASHGSLLRYLRTNRNRNILLPQQLLLRLATDVARALQYLAEKCVVHRNIMARKVFLSNDSGEIHVLLGGFEYAVKLNEDKGDHIGSLDESVALFWSASESLVYQRYSVKSDVWMFSVLCYEIFTLGCEPYQDYQQLTVEDITFKIVHHNLRFKKPDCIHNDLFLLMMQCMDNDPAKRPNYDVIINKLDDVTKRTIADAPGRPLSSQIPIIKVRRHSNSVSETKEIDDEYVYCTKETEVKTKMKSFTENESSFEDKHKLRQIPHPPPDLLLRSVNRQSLDEDTDIDQVVCMDLPLLCSQQSIRADDQPTMHSQLIENPTDQSLNCLMEKLPDGLGDWFLDDVIPSLSSCTYVSQPKGLIFGRQYLISEFPDEGDLASFVLSKHCNNTDELKQFAIQITSGLYELHQNGFVHRDLRLSHCYVYRDQDGRLQVKIGRLSRLKKLPQECLTHFCTVETDSLRWSAPEVITSGAYSKSSDVFSLGYVLWELYLYHSAPRETPSLRLIPYCTIQDNKIIDCHKRRKLPLRPPGCPTWLYSVITKCWSLSPQQRPDVATILKYISHEVSSYTVDNENESQSLLGQRPLPEPPINGNHRYRRPDPIYETIPADYQSERIDNSLPSQPPPSTEGRVLYDYNGKAGDELTVKAGDVIVVKERSNPGWWQCEFNGQFGLLPSNYVQIIRSHEISESRLESKTEIQSESKSELLPDSADNDGYLVPKRGVFKENVQSRGPLKAMVKVESSPELTSLRPASHRKTYPKVDTSGDTEYKQKSEKSEIRNENQVEVPRSWICAQTDGDLDDPYVLSCQPYYNVLPSRPMPLPGKLTRSQSLKLRRKRFLLEETSVSCHGNPEDPHYQVPRQIHVSDNNGVKTKVSSQQLKIGNAVTDKPLHHESVAGYRSMSPMTSHLTSYNAEPSTSPVTTRVSSPEISGTSSVTSPVTSTVTSSVQPTTPPKSARSKEMQRECQLIMKKFAPLPNPPENYPMECTQTISVSSQDFAKSIYKNFMPFYENISFHEDSSLLDTDASTKEVTKGNHGNESVNNQYEFDTCVVKNNSSQLMTSQFSSTKSSQVIHNTTLEDTHNMTSKVNNCMNSGVNDSMASVVNQGATSMVNHGLPSKVTNDAMAIDTDEILCTFADHSEISPHKGSHSEMKGHKSKDDSTVTARVKKPMLSRSLSFNSLSDAIKPSKSHSYPDKSDDVKIKVHKRRASFSAPFRALGLSQAKSHDKSHDKSQEKSNQSSNSNQSSPSKIPFLKAGLLPSPSVLRRSLRRSLSRSKKDNYSDT